MSRPWFDGLYRRNLVDMHIEDWNEEFLSQFDPVHYASLLKKAEVQVGMIYANSHVGLCNWPTRTGHMHRGLKGRDILGETIAECEKRDIRVVVYYSLIYNNRAYDDHPEWRIRDRQGRASRESGGPAGFLSRRYGVCCPNNEEYRNFVRAQIDEICEAYDFAGMFFDMNFWPDFCYCDACRARYDSEVGGEIPTVVNFQDPMWVTFQHKREEWIAEFGVMASNHAKSQKPGISTEHNAAALLAGWTGANTLRMLDAIDYTGGDLYGGTLSESFICKYFASVTPHMPFEYMVPRCYPTLRDHTTSKPSDMIEQQAFYALAHNGSFLFIDAIDPTGRLDPALYARVGDIFKKHAAYEPYLGGELDADVAVYYSLDSKVDTEAPSVEVGSPGAFRFAGNSPHFDGSLGAVRSCIEHNVPFSVIGAPRLASLHRYQVVVLSDMHAINEKERSSFLRFVEGGGTLYLSGMSGRFFQDEIGISWQGRIDQPVSYVKPTANAPAALAVIRPEAPLGVYEAQRQVSVQGDVDVWATITLPYTDSSDIPNDQIVQIPTGPEVLTERFASIHSNPPGVDTDMPAIVRRSFGKGSIVWVAAAIEKPDKHIHKQTFVSLVRGLMSEQATWSSDAPPAVEVLVHRQPARNMVVISAVNSQETYPPTTAAGIRVTVNKISKATRVRELPSGRDLPYETDDDSLTIRLPPVTIGAMIAVNTAT